MTEASRLDDIAACGSARTEHIGFSEEKLKAEKRPEDPNDIAAYLLTRHLWQDSGNTRGESPCFSVLVSTPRTQPQA